MTPRLAVTMGDPAGIGPEIVMKLLNDEACSHAGVVVVGDGRRLADAALRCGLPISLRPYRGPDTDTAQPTLLDLHNVPESLGFGCLAKEAGVAALQYITCATELALANEVQAIVTAPINKEAAQLSGQTVTGHTELLARLTHSPAVTMMLVSDSLRVAHVSTHVSLRQAIDSLTQERVETVVCLVHTFLTGKLGLARPRIAMAGLNPHAGEGGMFGQEDDLILRPVCERTLPLGVSGPYPPDTVFLRALSGEFDAVIAQYHDQGHIAMKMLGLDAGVNVTVGLPFLRTSVDHGTAFDIAGTGRASHLSLIRAVDLARKMLQPSSDQELHHT